MVVSLVVAVVVPAAAASATLRGDARRVVDNRAGLQAHMASQSRARVEEGQNAGIVPYCVSAWTFGSRPSLARATGARAIDEVDVDWYWSTAGGGVATSGEDPEYVAEAHAAGLSVLATVSNWSAAIGGFDPTIAAHILVSPASRAVHVAALIDLCASRGCDGIDLDWEMLRAGDRERFSLFVEALAVALHAQGKRLSIAVHAKESEPGSWSGAQAQDWRRLGAAADLLKIMTYDYSGAWSGPGPVSPPAWVDRVLAVAESQVDPAKVMMGVPFYGYDWCGKNVTSLTWSQATRLRQSRHAKLVRGPSREASFAYVRQRARHTVYYQDAAAIAAKLDVLARKHPRIAGICIWVMGGEDPAFWPLIAARLKASPAATP
jgi:spore germination protein